MNLFVWFLFSFELWLSLRAFFTVLYLLDNEQQLFVRLFLRKHQWIRVPKLSYPDIASNLSPLLRNLVQEGLLCDGQNYVRQREEGEGKNDKRTELNERKT